METSCFIGIRCPIDVNSELEHYHTFGFLYETGKLGQLSGIANQEMLLFANTVSIDGIQMVYCKFIYSEPTQFCLLAKLPAVTKKSFAMQTSHSYLAS